MKLDPRFQSMHPRTALWQQQRGQCSRCAHMREYSYARGNPGGMRCAIAPPYDGPARGIGKSLRAREMWGYCIDAREPGAVCGPDAVMFEPVVLT